MRRDLERLAREHFELLVIGGGIAGAAIARDAALRGLSVALIEKNDFAHATSAHNSKLIHGGLRYLRNFELTLVRESLRERRVWQRIAPHIVRPLPFLLPVYGGLAERATLSAGLSLYDALGFNRRWLRDPIQRLPRHRWLTQQAALAREPKLAGKRLSGAFLYWDAQMYSPERLALECVLDASLSGAAVANHLEATTPLIRNGRLEGAGVRDSIAGNQFDIRAHFTIVAAGPWTDIFLAQMMGAPGPKIKRSKGIHLIVPPITRADALTVAGRGWHFFVLPWRNHAIIGTTDTPFDGIPDEVCVTDGDIETFLGFVNAKLPTTNIRRSDVKHAYAGLRALIDEKSDNTYASSRRAELVDHAKLQGIDGLISVIGGKWTTSRALAEKSVDRVASQLGMKTKPCMTATAQLPGGEIDGSSKIAKGARDVQGALGTDHLARLYGCRATSVLALARQHSELARPLGGTGDIAAQFAFAAREEMAVTLEDAVMRRTGVGQLGNPGIEALEAAASLMAIELGWSETKKRAEIASLQTIFQPVGSTE